MSVVMRHPGDFRRDRCAKVLSFHSSKGLRQSHRHYRAFPVVTMRAMPQPTKTFRWLAQVTTPSDGLPDPLSSSIVQCDPSSRPLPAGSVKSRAEEAPLRALGQRLTSMNRLPTGSAIDAKNGCSRGKQQRKVCINREWCPESLVDLDTPKRSGRTETLTGQAGHTRHGKVVNQQQPGELTSPTNSNNSATASQREAATGEAADAVRRANRAIASNPEPTLEPRWRGCVCALAAVEHAQA